MAEPPRRPAWLEEILAGLPPAETAGVPTAASDLDVADVRPAGLSDSEVLIELPEEPRAGSPEPSSDGVAVQPSGPSAFRKASAIEAPAMFFRGGELEAYGAAPRGAESVSNLVNTAANTCQDANNHYVAWAVESVAVFLRPIGVRAGFDVTVEAFAQMNMIRVRRQLSGRKGFGFREGLRRRRLRREEAQLPRRPPEDPGH
eukprot:s444_g33.t1